MSNIERRTFISTAGGATVAGLATGLAGAAELEARENAAPGATFNLKYAPHFGMFNAISGKDHLDQLRFRRVGTRLLRELWRAAVVGHELF